MYDFIAVNERINNMDALRCGNCNKFIPNKEMPTKEEYSPPIGCLSYIYYCRDCLKILKENGTIK